MLSTTKNCGSRPVSSPAISKLCGSFVAQRLDPIDSFESRSVDAGSGTRTCSSMPMCRPALALLTLLAACSRAPLPGNGRATRRYRRPRRITHRRARCAALRRPRRVPLRRGRRRRGRGPELRGACAARRARRRRALRDVVPVRSAAARRRRLLQHAALHRRQRRERDLGRRPGRHGRRLTASPWRSASRSRSADTRTWTPATGWSAGARTASLATR